MRTFPLPGAALAALLIMLTGLQSAQSAPVSPAVESDPDVRFEIARYEIEGAALIKAEELAQVVQPYTGKDKLFGDVQKAVDAIEQAYLSRGYSAVHVILPEQTLEQGRVRITVIESRYGEITVLNNKFASKENILNALPSLRTGGVPRSQVMARELKLANESPSRQINVVLKEGKTDKEVDANILVSDVDPKGWSMTLDNSGTAETGQGRVGLAYRNSNIQDKDQIGAVQFQTSLEHPSRVMVVGGYYKLPRYDHGDAIEIFGGYSNVNSVVGGLGNFQGGGKLLSLHDILMLERFYGFENKLTWGIDWREYSSLKQTTPYELELSRKITTTPLMAEWSGFKRTDKISGSFKVSYSRNLPIMVGGKQADFDNYDPFGSLHPKSGYGILRFGGSLVIPQEEERQFNLRGEGQWTSDVLIMGEQFRLGGANGIRGFAEGSEGGETGYRLNFEEMGGNHYWKNYQYRGLLFYDMGSVTSKNASNNSIASCGVGLRANQLDKMTLQLDAGYILKAGTDSGYRNGDKHLHASLTINF